jgi:NADPH:quinone reductase-like Zn-dependent oxidoreductase
MLAVFAADTDPDDPLRVLTIGERPEPETPDGWAIVTPRAASLNHHDLWSLRGVGLSEERLPMILGCDAAGVDEDGNDVIVHAVVADASWRGDETFDPKRSILSERHQGTFAERVAVPRRNLVTKPAELSFEEAACLPTAWLTAYRMLFTRARVVPGNTILVQGASGGVATALTVLASAAGARVWVTSRERVDAVMETVGEATWKHSLRSLKPGGTLVVCGATSGDAPSAELNRVFFLQLSIVGSTMGTRDELERLARFCVDKGARPLIHRTMPLRDARGGFESLLGGQVAGKIVLTP